MPMARQTYGVFAFAAAQFKSYRIGVAEHFVAPLPTQRKALGLKPGERIFIHEAYLLHIGEFAQFVFSH